MPLSLYLSPEITLPLLSARGCYWGKCEFCHHGMVYGEKYAPYRPVDVLEAVSALAERYGVRRFAFNDEAVPPKVLRAMGNSFPSHAESGWTFTGLIKFEPTYTADDFARFYHIGCRSLYVGLESASPRVLDLMKKRATTDTILRNLRDATAAGIWMHCFLFFGFPGETDEDAEVTYRFVLDNTDVVSSYGGGVFALEHNSPIYQSHDAFGLRLEESEQDALTVYYGYAVDKGISPERARWWRERLYDASGELSHYRVSEWVPRELLLSVLSRSSRETFLSYGSTVWSYGGLPARSETHRVFTMIEDQGGPWRIINRATGGVAEVSSEVGAALRPWIEMGSVCEAPEAEAATVRVLMSPWIEMVEAGVLGDVGEADVLV